MRPWLTTGTRNVGATVLQNEISAPWPAGSLAVKIRWLGAHLLGPGWTRNAHQPHATWLTYLPLASCSKKTGSRAACVYMQKYLSHCL